MRGSRSRALIVLTAAVVALGAAGCGGDDAEAPEALEGTAAEDALAEAAIATNENTETIEARLEGSISGLPTGDQEFSFDGFVDPQAETGSVEVSVGEGTFELILLEDVAFLTSDDDAFLDALPEGAEWVELTIEELNSVGIDTAFSEGAFSPQLYLALGANDVEAGEADEIGDDPVRAYSFTIDEAEAVEEAPDDVRASVEDAISLEGDNPMIDGEASIDAEGRMRSFSAVGTVEPSGDLETSTDGIEVRIGTEYRAFGVDVPADPPSEDATVPFAEAPEALTALESILVSD